MRLRTILPAMNRRSAVRVFLLAVAISCLGFYAYASLRRLAYQTYESRLFDRIPDRSSASLAPSIESTGPTGRKAVSSSRRPSQTALIGRLSIPRLHLSAMVREGIDWNTLEMAIGHIPSTALPGRPATSAWPATARRSFAG